MLPRTTRQRRRRDRPRPLLTLSRGIVVVALGCALLVGLPQLYNGIPTTDYRYVNASLPTIGNLLPHDFVRIAGKRVGQVQRVDVGEDGRPLIRLQLQPGLRLPRDSKVRVRANGLLGARYVQLIPGRAAELLDNDATIRGANDAYTYGLPEVLQTFDPQTRVGLKATVANLGEGLLGNGAALNGALQDTAQNARDFDELARAVLERDGAAERLIPAASSALRALRSTEDQVPEFLASANDALRPLARERTALRDTLDRAPAALAATRAGLEEGRTLLTGVRALSEQLDPALRPAPEGLRELGLLLGESERPLKRTEPLLTAVRRAVPPTLRTLDALMPVVTRGRPAIDLLRPVLKQVGDYGCDIENTGAVMRSMTGFAQQGTGPLGPLMAFRLQAVTPDGLDGVGVDEPRLRRGAYQPPCSTVSKPYPQFIPTTTKRAAP